MAAPKSRKGQAGRSRLGVPGRAPPPLRWSSSMGASSRLVLALALMMMLSSAAVSGGTGQDQDADEPPAVVDLEMDAVGDAVGLEMDKSVGLSAHDQPITFPLPGEEGSFEVYKGFRDIAAAENFTAMDYLSIRGAVLALAPDDGDPTTFPMCELFKIGAPLRLHCVITGLSMRVLTRNPPDVRAASTERPALHVGGLGKRGETPPHQLQEPETYPVPTFLTDQRLIDEEKPVYYWFYRHVLNMYEFAYRWSDEQEGMRQADLLPMLPDGAGYGNQSLIWMAGPSEMSFRRPFGHCFTYFPDRGGQGGRPQLICVMRGTIYAEEWVSNFRLQAIEPEEMHGVGLDGVVCSGFFAMMKEVLPQISAALSAHPELHEITLAGHSLGGAMALLVATYLGHVHPALKINVVSYGAPNFGDERFMQFFRKDINVRQLAYVGSGLRGNHKDDPMSFGVGDIIPQMPPDCISVSSCPLATLRAGDTPKDLHARHMLARAPGIIKFYATDMPNSERWLFWEDYFVHIFTRMDRGLISAHMCSYQCWLASWVNDPETRCYFPEQGRRDPREICDLLASRDATSKITAPA